MTTSQQSQIGGATGTPSCQIRDHEYYQSSQFKRVNEVCLKHVTETIDKFDKKFTTQINSVEQKLNEKNLSKLAFVHEDFDALSVETKEFFLKKLQEKVMKDAKQRILNGGEDHRTSDLPKSLGHKVDVTNL